MLRSVLHYFDVFDWINSPAVHAHQLIWFQIPEGHCNTLVVTRKSLYVAILASCRCDELSRREESGLQTSCVLVNFYAIRGWRD